LIERFYDESGEIMEKGTIKNRNLINFINSPEDVRKLSEDEVENLAFEIREFLIEKVSKTGGHLASNLGVVELTLAIHKIFDTAKDRLIWDVGHQSYVHKILTGRRELFDTLRKTNGISGFPKVNESQHDAFNTGHSSTSISAALGLARARTLLGESHSVVAVIGDGAMTGGMAFEALNDAGQSKENLIVILNDNEMSISKNVGGLSKYLSKVRTGPLYHRVKEDLDIILNKIPSIKQSALKAIDAVKGSIKYLAIPGIIFEELGFKYLGPIDGHNSNELADVLKRAKEEKGPVLVHVCTQKGKGYEYAENSPHLYHGVSPFEIETGEAVSKSGKGYSHIFGDTVIDLANEDEKVVAITAAMPHGTGLEKYAHKFPKRFF
jgi:1-deoxy-D-xylulose-5-phosphate synthase